MSHEHQPDPTWATSFKKKKTQILANWLVVSTPLKNIEKY
jgi:hypothetical protein